MDGWIDGWMDGDVLAELRMLNVTYNTYDIAPANTGSFFAMRSPSNRNQRKEISLI